MGFARKTPASVLVPTCDSLYILIPIPYQVLLLPGFAIWSIKIAGITLIIFGIVLMNKLVMQRE
ncbi:MAG TPA: hypothetical protein VKM55_22230 [Candidatus Lokiarchaeia archaeon]|nr:hypothetical protein [Candidatus Lokiarchaeia archaeon]